MAASHQNARSRKAEHQHFKHGNNRHNPLLLAHKTDRKLHKADDGERRKKSDTNEIAYVALTEASQPQPLMCPQRGRRRRSASTGAAFGPEESAASAHQKYRARR